MTTRRQIGISIQRSNHSSDPEMEYLDYEQETDSCEHIKEKVKVADEPYLCFDVNRRRKKMTRMQVKTAGSTVTMFCNVKGVWSVLSHFLKTNANELT